MPRFGPNPGMVFELTLRPNIPNYLDLPAFRKGACSPLSYLGPLPNVGGHCMGVSKY